jgi:16S rRNA (guanine966-N2)-methyltransferase
MSAMMRAMRIIAGSAKGRRLKAPPGKQTRPTSDRVREAVFSILGPPPAGALVLDLFAGSGALGLEAVSRGAQKAIFVDQDSAALQTLRHNIEGLSLVECCQVVKGDAMRTLKRLAREQQRFHWIFIDPPYATSLAQQSLHEIGEASMLAGEAQVIVEHDKRSEPDDAFGTLLKTDSRRYGDTVVSFYQRKTA